VKRLGCSIYLIARSLEPIRDENLDKLAVWNNGRGTSAKRRST
jgi:hypothetical protein